MLPAWWACCVRQPSASLRQFSVHYTIREFPVVANHEQAVLARLVSDDVSSTGVFVSASTRCAKALASQWKALLMHGASRLNMWTLTVAAADALFRTSRSPTQCERSAAVPLRDWQFLHCLRNPFAPNALDAVDSAGIAANPRYARATSAMCTEPRSR